MFDRTRQHGELQNKQKQILFKK